MSKLGGFRIGHKMVRIWRYNKFLRFKFRAARSGQSVATKLVGWGRKIKQRLRGGGGSYYRLGEKNDRLEPVTPKGQLAVYVGQMRYLVPVIYFNNPLFGELLKEAEAEFGFHHPGGITIPCPVSEFERVQTRIKNAEPARKNGFTRL